MLVVLLWLLVNLSAAQIVYRKGLPFGAVPTFRRMSVGEGVIRCGDLVLPCQYGGFGPTSSVSGMLAVAHPAEADTVVASGVKGAIAIVSRGACSFETKMRNCASSGAAAVVLVNSDDERFLAVPDEPAATRRTEVDIPFVVVSSSDGAALGGVVDPITISPLPLDAGVPLFPFERPLLPGASRRVTVGKEEWRALEACVAEDGTPARAVVLMCNKDAALAETGTVARVELRGEHPGAPNAHALLFHKPS